MVWCATAKEVDCVGIPLLQDTKVRTNNVSLSDRIAYGTIVGVVVVMVIKYAANLQKYSKKNQR